MPDRSLMTAFTQATGPFSRNATPPGPGRTRAPKALQAFLWKNGYPPDQSGATGAIDPKWDFWGLKLSAIFLRSTNGGATWQRWHTDNYRAVYPHPYSGQSIVGLRDGSVLRTVNGFDL